MPVWQLSPCMNEFYFFCPCCHHYLPTRVRLLNLRQLAANDPSTRIIACLSHFLRFSPRRKQKDFFLSSVKIVIFCYHLCELLFDHRRKKRRELFVRVCARSHTNAHPFGSYPEWVNHINCSFFLTSWVYRVYS